MGKLMVARLLACIIFIQAHFVATRFYENGYGYKTYEFPGRPIQFHLCGDQIYQVYVQLCVDPYDKRAKRDEHDVGGIQIKKKNAMNFFKKLKRFRRGAYNIVEECCIEGCVKEEVEEYCPY